MSVHSRKELLRERVQIHPDGSKEYWRNVLGYEGLYRISDRGRVRSVERKARIGGGSFRRVRSRILKQAFLNPNNIIKSYLVVNLAKQGKAKICLVHRLVLEAFIGPCPEGMQACHNDGDPHNNCPQNLRWDTSQNNADDCIAHGTRQNIQGESHYKAKMTETKVLKIRKLFGTGKYTQQDLAALFDISFVTVHKIVKRRSWKHI